MYAFEWFRDSEAVLKHIAATAGTLQRLSEVTDPKRIEIIGNASPELAEAAASFGAKSYRHWYGFTR